MEFYLDTISTWNYKALIEHLRKSFEMGEHFSSLVGGFYIWSQCNKETEDQFVDDLQILSRKVFSICPEWKAEVNEALKAQFAFRLCDPCLVAMAHNFLKTQGKDISITQCHAKCIFMFDSYTKKRHKVRTAAHAIDDITSVKIGEQKKAHSQVHGQKTKKKWQVQTDLIEQQKKEIEKFKAAQAPGANPQQLVKAITQAMSCMCVYKEISKWARDQGKPFLGTARPPELSQGLDGSLD